MGATSALEQVMQKVLDKLTEHDGYFEVIAEKISNIELRQSHASGEINDAMRAAHQYAIGESSNMPHKACQSVCEIIMMGDRPTYWQAFLNKDIRRCEFELYKFFEAFCKSNVQAVVETQHSTGEPVIMLPSTRAKLVQCEKDIESMLPKLHEDLVKLYKLTMPMSRACNPTTVAELKDRKVLPEHCRYKTLDEAEAKHVLGKLKQKHSKVDEIENDKYENWHMPPLRFRVALDGSSGCAFDLGRRACWAR